VHSLSCNWARPCAFAVPKQAARAVRMMFDNFILLFSPIGQVARNMLPLWGREGEAAVFYKRAAPLGQVGSCGCESAVTR
jgi:hypothetical protein